MRNGHGARRLATVVVMLASTVLVAGCGPDPSARAASLEAWHDIETVLTHPRCLNCHQMESPLQGNEPRPHVPMVVRGPGNHGVSAMQCLNCHNQSGNNPTSRVPGAPHWSLSPESMVWQGLSSGELCRMLIDEARNGGRSPDALVEHMGQDPLVLWGWDPGADRDPVPIGHEQFMQIVETWVAGGTACPG